ncbi:MAG: hypothetical protein CMJ46_02055 [Planctomyces sp.]|nr:hypothetical protein [Planctomyces sp.]
MISRRPMNALAALVCLLLLVVSSTGCTSLKLAQAMRFDLDKPFPWETDDDEPKVPDRLVAVWKDTILNQRNQKGVRGFGGRVLFYDSQGKQPIIVKGSLVVYAFDNTTDTNDPVPDRKFIFKAEDLEKHYSKAALGHSYSFWIPWDEVGGEPRKISLLVRFEDESGATVVSDPTMQTLPGIPKGYMANRSKKSNKPEDEEEIAITTAAYEEPQKARPIPERHLESSRMQTETINIPSRFQNRHLNEEQAEWDFSGAGESSVPEANDDFSHSTEKRAPAELPLEESAQPLEKQKVSAESAAQEAEIQALRASLEQMKAQLAQVSQQKKETAAPYQTWQDKRVKQLPLKEYQESSGAGQSSLRARYEQYLRQARTSESEHIDRVGGPTPPLPAGSRYPDQTAPQSREQQTEWEWTTPESAAGRSPSL